MNVLGIAGSQKHASAAIAIDGRIAAAAAEESFIRVPNVGYRLTGGYPLAAIQACLDRAGTTLADVERVMAVADGDSTEGAATRPAVVGLPVPNSAAESLRRHLRTRAWASIDPVRADARLVATARETDESLVLVVGAEVGRSAAFRQRGADLIAVQGFAGVDHLVCAIRQVGEAVGVNHGGLPALERLGSKGAATTETFQGALEWRPGSGFAVNQEQFLSVLAPLQADARMPDSAFSPRVTQLRQGLATDFCAHVTNLIVEAAASMVERTGLPRIGFGGELCASPGLMAAIVRTFGDDALVAPVPQAVGRAMGAALDGGGPAPAVLHSLALGPEFSDAAIKGVLENCRLDYVYEPDFSRLIGRISRMLARGTTVGWFQGAMGFGPNAVGTRSVLCDPSNQYARENINCFLRHAPIDDPVPVSMVKAAIDECLDPAVGSPFGTMAANVLPRWRDHLRGALDHRQQILVHLAIAEQSPELAQLLELHRERTGVPGLINATLNGSGEPVACTPRDAVRTVFSSAIDALVIGRFLLMKDYWLLRSDAK